MTTDSLASFSLTDLNSTQDPSSSPLSNPSSKTSFNVSSSLGFGRPNQRKQSSARRTLLFGTDDSSDNITTQSSSVTDNPPSLTLLQRGAVTAMCLSLIGSFFSGNIIYPFAPFMVHDFFPHISENKLGYYTGYLDSAFYFGPLISSVYWARLSDQHGRRGVIQCAMLGTAVLSAAFGLSVNFAMAVCIRFLWGLLDSSVAIVKTTMGDLVKDPDFTMDQARLFGLIGLCGGFGRTFGSFLGGWLSAVYGGENNHRKCHALTRVFCAFPYFLPCLAPACLIFVALGFVYFYFPETSNISNRNKSSNISSIAMADKSSVVLPQVISNESTDDLIQNGKSMKMISPESEEISSNTINKSFLSASSSNNGHSSTKAVGWAEVMKEKELLMSVLIYFLTCIYSTGFNSSAPVWLLTANNSEGHGFDMRVNDIGTVWAVVGPVYMFTQTFLYHRICGWLGYMMTAQVSLVFSGMCCFILPFLSTNALLGGFESRADLPSWRQWLNILMVALVSGLLIASRVMAISTLTLIVNNASRNAAAMRATANGMSQAMGSLGRLIAPVIFCNMFAAIVAYDSKHGSSFLTYRFSFYMLALLAFICAALVRYSFGSDFESRLHAKSDSCQTLHTESNRMSTSVELMNTFSKLDESSVDSTHSSLSESV